MVKGQKQTHWTKPHSDITPLDKTPLTELAGSLDKTPTPKTPNFKFYFKYFLNYEV